MIIHPKKCTHCGTPGAWLTTIQLGPFNKKELEWDCCGAREKLHPRYYLMTFGQHGGSTVDEINDERYLRWLKDDAKEKGNWLLFECVKLKQNGTV